MPPQIAEPASDFEDLEVPFTVYHQTPDGEPHEISAEQFCETKILEKSGLHIFYLPSVKYALGLERKAGIREKRAYDQEKLRAHLENEFHIPPFFWGKTGWDANGFFWNAIDVVRKTFDNGSGNPKDGETVTLQSHASSSLFLVKELLDKNSGSYSWRYLTLSTLWFCHNDDDRASETMMVLLFDTRDYEKASSEAMVQLDPISRQFADSLNTKWWKQVHGSRCQHRIYIPFLKAILPLYNDAIWSFRTPVRGIEKNEIFARTADQQLQGSRQYLSEILNDRKKRVDNYKLMHDLLRHIIHASETLSVAVRTIADMKHTAEVCLAPCCSVDSESQVRKSHSEITGSINFYASYFASMKDRSEAFRIRLENEIKLAFNIVDALDSTVSGQMLIYTGDLLEDTKSDGRELTQFVSNLSIIFLPPTFTAGFFGMNFFDFKSWRLVWVWFVITIPLVIIASAFKYKATRKILLHILLLKFVPFDRIVTRFFSNRGF